MQIFVLATLKQVLTPEQRQTVLPKEVPHTLELYLDGAIVQFWFREQIGPIFLMEAESVEAAKAVVARMPLAQADLATYEFWPVGPLSPLRMLLPAA